MDISIDTRHRVIPLPEVNFETFYKRFNKVSDITKTKEWLEIYSHYYSFDKYEMSINIKETKDDVEKYTPEQRHMENIKCAMSFPYFCHKYIKIMHPMQGLIPFILYNYQRRVIQDYDNFRFNMISKFRQGGLTTVTVLWGLWRCLFKLDQQIMTISKTDREATTAGDIARRAMEYLPTWMVPVLTENNKHEKSFSDTDSVLKFHTPMAARGKSMTILIVDEAAFVENMEEHWAALYPTINMGGACIVISTVHGMGNWYEQEYHKAEAGENQFHVIDLDYWEHPEYNHPDWIESTRRNLGIKKWRQEIERSFLGSGDTFISTEIVGELDQYTRDKRPLKISMGQWSNKIIDKKLDWEDGAFWQWKKPIEAREYILSADAAEGVGDAGDNSAFQVIDAMSLEQVAEFYSNNIPPREFTKVLHLIGTYYNKATLVVEREKYGVTILDMLEKDLGYENIYYELIGKQHKPGIKPEKNKRAQYLEVLQHRLESRHLKVNSRRFVSELNTFMFNPITKRVQAQTGKHDDLIMAMCMALFVRDILFHDAPCGSDPSIDNPSSIFRSELFEQIKREILEEDADNWLEETKEEKPWLYLDDREDMESIYRTIRHNDKLLREFNF